jgi:protein TonB
MFARIAIAVVAGVAVTTGLLFLMQLAIATGEGGVEPRAERIVDFVRVDRSQEVFTEASRPVRPDTPERAPDMAPPQATSDFTGAGTIALAFAAPAVEFGTEVGRSRFGSGDGEYLPIVKVAPIYPSRALQRRLEGYVVVEFVVTSSGAVRDVRVVESTAEIFEAAAIEAAQKFKYRPRIIDGQPIEVPGVRNRISFTFQA